MSASYRNNLLSFFLCHIFLELFFRLFLIFDYLPIIDQMPFSLLNHSFMTFHFFTILIKGISCGELLCNTTLILIGRCFISHWTLPPCPYFLSPILSNKESSLSFPILLRMISRLIPWKWCVGILFSLSFSDRCSVRTYTINPDTWFSEKFKWFIYLSERVFTGFSLFLSLVCLWFYNNRQSLICQHIFLYFYYFFNF